MSYLNIENYERRQAGVEACCKANGIKDLEEAKAICASYGIDAYNIVFETQKICFEDAKWAYVLGCAIALKRGVKSAEEAAKAIGEGLQAFCVPGSVAANRNVGIGHGNLGGMLLNDSVTCFAFLAGHESFAAAEGAIKIALNANKARKVPLKVILNGLGKDAAYIISRINGFTYVQTEYDPYSKSNKAGAYRSIGVPNSDDSGILQIRPYMPKELKGIEWMSLGGSGFTACFAQYVNVDSFDAYISKTSKEVNTNYMYWASRLIAALTDAHYFKSVMETERYVSQVFNESYRILNEYDKKMLKSKDYSLCKQANTELIEMLKKKSNDVLDKVLENASNDMKTRYHRGDN